MLENLARLRGKDPEMAGSVIFLTAASHPLQGSVGTELGHFQLPNNKVWRCHQLLALGNKDQQYLQIKMKLENFF